MKIEFRSPLSVENHCDNKLGKDSKKNSVDKFWEPLLNDIEEEHSVLLSFIHQPVLKTIVILSYAKTRKAPLKRYWNYPSMTTLKRRIQCKVYAKKKIY